MTKLHDLHGYLYIHKADVLILNETWLKKSILDTEILPGCYNIIRLDRSIKTHPWDPDHPKKFRKNGGSVLVAHRNDVNISSSKVNFVTSQAELLSIIIEFSNYKKLCVSTVYRVDTLGITNFHEIKINFEALAVVCKPPLVNKIEKNIALFGSHGGFYTEYLNLNPFLHFCGRARLK